VDAGKDRIVSVAASARDGDASFYSLVNPGVPIPAGASRVNGIFDDHVATAPCWADVSARLFDFIAQHAGARPVLVAYNGMHFDFPLLVAESKRAAVNGRLSDTFEQIYGCDALKIARQELSKLPSKRLANVYKHLFDEEMPGAHTASGDVAALKRVCHHEKIKPHLESFIVRFANSKLAA
jgi:DNA polymerase III epsilon subunit-like protein